MVTTSKAFFIGIHSRCSMLLGAEVLGCHGGHLPSPAALWWNTPIGYSNGCCLVVKYR